MYIASLADASYLFFTTDYYYSDGVMLDIQFNFNQRDSSKNKLLHPRNVGLMDGCAIKLPHNQWRKMTVDNVEGFKLSRLRYNDGFMLSFKTWYEMLNRCTFDKDDPLLFLKTMAKCFSEDNESHNTIINFHIAFYQNDIDHLMLSKV